MSVGSVGSSSPPPAAVAATPPVAKPPAPPAAAPATDTVTLSPAAQKAISGDKDHDGDAR